MRGGYFLIADIEGDEKKLLAGMKNIIKNNKPKMAICVYHRPNDIWEIMKIVGEIDNTYKFDMLHHGVDSSETVLYCY